MSWLLVAFIPGLLMLATFGLERLEAGLERDNAAPRRPDVRASPRTTRGTDLLDRTQPIRQAPLEYAGAPTRPATPQRINPQFPATRQADRV
ncbi:hypothetical protein ACWDUN_11415 [Mycobacterium sp. NPDC003323]